MYMYVYMYVHTYVYVNTYNMHTQARMYLRSCMKAYMNGKHVTYTSTQHTRVIT